MTMPALRALLVEDNELDAALVARALGPQAQTTRVESPDELRGALADPRGWDVILTDHALPALDTFRVLDQVREAHVDPPVIVVSGQIGEENLARAMVEGAVDYVPKERLGLLPVAVERAVRAKRDSRWRERIERQRRAFFEMSDELFAVASADARPLLYNAAWTRILGRTDKELRERGLIEPVHAEDEGIARASWEAVARGSPVRGAEWRVLDVDGGVHTILWNMRAIPDERIVCVVARDVTVQKREAEIARRQERLASLGALVAGVAHELNNPLTYTRGNVELLELGLATTLPDLPPGPARARLEDLRNAIADSIKGIDRIAAVADGLRRVAGTAPGPRREEEINVLVDSVLALAKPRLDGAKLVRDYARDVRACVSASDVSQVVLNLVLNAADAVRGRDVRTVTVRTRARDKTVTIEVQDDGPGIAEEDRAKVFLPFFTTKVTGTGLGLSISRRIVEDHGGALDFTTGPRGATFTARLPRLAEEQPAAEVAAR